MRKNYFYVVCGAAFLLYIAACGQTGVRSMSRTQDKDISRPSRILVYNFAVSAQDVKEYQGIMRQQPSIKDPAEREREIARNVVEALAGELVDGLRALGFTVERVERGTAATSNDLVIDGQFVDVNEGNKLHRVVVGFGSGASTVDTQVQVYQGTERRKLLEFATHSNSGNLPGAAPMLGAGAAVQGGVTAGMVIGNAALTGVKAYRSEVERMAGYSGDQVARYLSEFFAQHGWIRQDQVKKARIAY